MNECIKPSENMRHWNYTKINLKCFKTSKAFPKYVFILEESRCIQRMLHKIHFCVSGVQT